MCGIVGVIAESEAAPMLTQALSRLEYRGYDSAGVATLDDGEIVRRRAVGKLSELTTLLRQSPIRGSIGVGHTRWATHGAPSAVNAHPHATERVAVVHNGIVENYRELREELQDEGYDFKSETDTETVALLCDHYLKQGMSPADAVSTTLTRLTGAYALCFLFRGHDDLLIAARQGSPLALGYGDGEMFVGSDALALAPMTSRICYLDEGDWAVVTHSDARIFDAHGQPAKREIKIVPQMAAAVDRGEYRHFMAKEIHEQPSSIAYTLGQYLTTDHQDIALPQNGEGRVDFAATPRITLVACGTAYYACMVAKYWFEQVAHLPVEVDIASEFRYRQPPLPQGGVALFVSQSGETADTLAALRYCRKHGQLIAAVVNVAESSMAREADVVFPTAAGPEIGVASTKAFTAQLVVLAVLAIEAARQRGRMKPQAVARMVAALNELPSKVSKVLSLEKRIARIAFHLSHARSVLFLGRGAMYPIALEAALKLKEVSYIHSEGYASGELKHGPIALVEPEVPVVVLAPKEELFEKTISNMHEVMARGGKISLISDREGLDHADEGVWQTLAIPKAPQMLAPILHAVPVQLLAYHTAVHKGTDVDQPRNLAKSVTVE